MPFEKLKKVCVLEWNVIEDESEDSGIEIDVEMLKMEQKVLFL